MSSFDSPLFCVCSRTTVMDVMCTTTTPSRSAEAGPKRSLSSQQKFRCKLPYKTDKPLPRQILARQSETQGTFSQ